MKKVDFDDYAHQYEEILKEQLHFFDDADYFSEYKIKLVKKYLVEEPKKILEYGCGTGKNLTFIKQLFPNSKIYGFDISKQSLAVAAKNNPDIEFVLPDKVDLIFISGVLHHVLPQERAGLISELSHLLVPKGELFIFEHNPYNPVTRHLVNTCIFDRDAILIAARKLKLLLKGNNFTIQKLRYTLFIPNWLKQFRFLENYLGFLPMGGQYFIYAKSSL